MAALPLRSFRPRPAALAASPPALHILRPIHQLQRRIPLSAPLKMQARTRDPFHSNCAEREPEPENHDPDKKAAISKNFHLVDKLLKYVQTVRAEMGIRETPDMFITEKERISSYEMKLSSSPATMDVEETVMAIVVCRRAQEALDLASFVMDIASLRRGTIQFCQHTVDQMVRTYAAIFCNVAKDVYHNKFEMETFLSFLAALRGFGAIYHILVQDTVAKLKDGRFKNSITHHMGKYSQDFDKAVRYLEDVIVETKPRESPRTVTCVLWDGVVFARIYVASLADCREAALRYLKD